MKNLTNFVKAWLAIAMISPFTVNATTLEQAVAITLDTHPELRIAFNQYKAKQAQIDQAFANYLPNIELNAGYGVERTDSIGTRTNPAHEGDVELNRGEAGLSIRQILFDGFLTGSEMDRYSFEAKAQQWALLSAAEDKALEVSKVYLGYIHSKEVLILAEKNLQTHKKIYQQIKQKTDSGLGSIADLSQITGRLANANANVIAAQNNLEDNAAIYARVIGIKPDKIITPVPDADKLPKAFAEALALSQENHPILKAATQDIYAAKKERTSSQSKYFPRITLELNGNWNNDLNGNDGHNESSSVGGHSNDLQAMVRLRYNLFAGGKDAAKERESAYKINEAKEIKQRAYRQIEESVQLSWNAYQYLGQQKNFIQQHVTSAKQSQVAYVQQFNLGQRTLLDLLDTENELFEARKRYLQAEFDEIIAKYRMLNATGRLLDSLKVTRPESWL